MTHLLLQWLPSELFHRIELLWREVGVVSGCHLDLKFAEGIISKRYKAALDGQIDVAFQVLQVLGYCVGVVVTRNQEGFEALKKLQRHFMKSHRRAAGRKAFSSCHVLSWFTRIEGLISAVCSSDR